MRFWRAFDTRFTCPCGSVAVFVSAHACCLTLSAKQDGLRYAPFLFHRSRSPFVRSRCAGVVIGLGWFTSGLGVYLRRSRRGAGDAWERGWRRGACASLCKRIGFTMLSAGRTLGLRAPDCAKESSTLWTLFTLRRGYVGAYTRPPSPGYTGRPARLRPMVGRVVLYSDDTNTYNRPDSSRPQAAKSRVARAKRSGCRLCRP